MRKSQISLATNWIFVMVAGSLIILILVGAAFKQRSTYQYHISKTMADTIMYSLTTVLNSENTFNQLKNLPKFDFQTVCYNDYLGIFISDYEENLNFVFFAPPLGEGTIALTWSLAWKPAYPITNFVYFLTTQNKIAIINTTNKLLQNICKDLSNYFHSMANVKCYNNIDDVEKDLKNELISTLTLVKDKDDYISWDDLFNAAKKSKKVVKKENIFLLSLADDKEHGSVNVTYYESGSQIEKELNYVSLPHLIGLIVSGNPELYLCVSRKASRIASMIDSILYKRTKSLADHSFDECKGLFYAIATKIKDLMNLENEFKYITDKSNMTAYVNDYNIIQNINDNQLTLSSCELVY